MPVKSTTSEALPGRRLRIRGLVQGVGFRPTVWRIAHELGLHGQVYNDGGGVIVELAGSPPRLDAFATRLQAECPPLARIDSIEAAPMPAVTGPGGFRITASRETAIHTGVVADAATCAQCRSEIDDPDNRRHRYAFTNCTHCGPRFSVVHGVPYDRANTSMSAFTLCPACAREYRDPADRRFHAQPNACPACGPRLALCDAHGRDIDCQDPVRAAGTALRRGSILALKGIGGVHLACDATNEATVERLRRHKHRPHKPLALMACNLEQVREYCAVGEIEARELQSPAAPIVLLPGDGAMSPADAVAPGQRQLGFMLPYSPLHHLLMAELDRPIVLTSGNLSEEPQCIDNADSVQRLGGIADLFLLHDRDIVNRIDDSVVRVVDGAARLLRRARGYAPAMLPLPAGFDCGNGVLALGGELKNTFCLLQDNHAILAQHMGDLEDARTFDDFVHNLDLYFALYRFRPTAVAIDAHPGYLSSQHGRVLARARDIPLHGIQHHHAHLASCLGDNAIPRDHPPVLGILLDGLGLGDDGGLWGGEFLLGGYRDCTRVAHLKAVALPGAAQAMREPWRNTFAHLLAAGLWDGLAIGHPALPLVQRMQARPLRMIRHMLREGINSPPSSSAGRLFDAVAEAAGIAPETLSYEGQAAIALENLVPDTLPDVAPYPFGLLPGTGVAQIDPAPMWRALLDDLVGAAPPERIAIRFHLGFAAVLADMTRLLATRHAVEQVALSGGVFQNATLFRLVRRGLEQDGFSVLSQRQVPGNDGGLALGQALIVASRAERH